MKFLQIILAILIGFASTALYQHRASISDFVTFAITSASNYYDLFGNTTAPLNETQKASSSEATAASSFPNLGYPEQHLTVSEMSVPRAVAKIVHAIEQAEGAGARVRRSIGTRSQRYFTPFLMLDHFATSDGAGFPDQ